MVVRMMAFSHLCTPAHLTGAEKLLYFTLLEMKAQHECVLVVPNEGMLAQLARASGIGVEVVGYEPVWSMYAAGAEFGLELQQKLAAGKGAVLELLHRYCPDWVLVNTCVNAVPAGAAKTAGIPTVWFIHEVLSATPHTPAVVQWIASHADVLIGCSQTVLDPFREVYVRNRLVMYPSAGMPDSEYGRMNVRQAKRHELGLAESEIAVGFLASDLVPAKGMADFVEMALTICPVYAHVRFCIVGNATDPEYYHRCLERVRTSGYESRFVFLPFQHSMETIYPLLDIVVVPSLVTEGFGMTAMEGMMYGKPVVAYRSGGLAELMQLSGNADYLAEPGRISELSYLVIQLIANPWLMQQLGNQNFAAYRNLFGIEAFHNRLWTLYESIGTISQERRNRRWAAMYRIPDGVLLQGGESSRVYLLEDGRRRPFADMQSLQAYGRTPDEIVRVHDSELQNYPEGAAVQLPVHAAHAPSFWLAKGSGPAIYLIRDGVRHPFATQDVFRLLQFDPRAVLKVPDSLLDAMPQGGAVAGPLLEDATPIPGKVYRTPAGTWLYAAGRVLRKINFAEAAFFRWRKKLPLLLSDADAGRLMTQ